MRVTSQGSNRPNAALMSLPRRSAAGASINGVAGASSRSTREPVCDRTRMLKIMKLKSIDMLGDESRWEELFDKYPGQGDLRHLEGGRRSRLRSCRHRRSRLHHRHRW